jgi:hypothetical protein
MPCLVSLTGKDGDFQSLSWATWATTLYTCSASNPGRTIRLRPFLNRISTLESPGVLGPCPATCTSKNFVGASFSSRFFHTKKYGRHKPCSRQNAFTLCPLRACSETSLRHFIQAFFERLVMSQHCNATRIFTRWGSLSAYIIYYIGHIGRRDCGRVSTDLWSRINAVK